MTDETTTLSVTLTEAAAAKVREVMGAQTDLTADEQHLRLFVQGGGCGGPSFGLCFDRKEADDTRFESEGVSILVDPVSLPYAAGASVDFVESPEVTGFRVTAPRAAAGCGSQCGPGASPESGGCSSGGCGC